jgi:hypothetical protein
MSTLTTLRSNVVRDACTVASDLIASGDVIYGLVEDRVLERATVTASALTVDGVTYPIRVTRSDCPPAGFAVRTEANRPGTSYQASRLYVALGAAVHGLVLLHTRRVMDGDLGELYAGTYEAACS